MKKKKLKKWLLAQIKRSESNAEECIQDRDNPEAADKEFAKAEAFQDVIDFINIQNDGSDTLRCVTAKPLSESEIKSLYLIPNQ